MRKWVTAYLFILGTLLLNVAKAQLVSRSYWINLDNTDGLIDNEVMALAVKNDSIIYVGTSNGLSVMIDGKFTNYSTANSNLNSGKIYDLKIAHNRLWLHTDSGLSSFNGSTFTNYTENNGLLSRHLSLAVTPSDTLWVGTGRGVSKFDGQKFIHDSSKVAFDIESDSLGRIYIAYRGRPNFQVEIYDSSKWTAYNSLNLFGFADFKRLHSGELILWGASGNGYSEVSYPLTLTEKPLHYGHTGNIFNFQARDIDKSDERIWAFDKNYYIDTMFRSTTLLYSADDSILQPHKISKRIGGSQAIAFTKDLVIVGTNGGLFYAAKDIQDPSSSAIDISINSIKTTVYSDRPAFAHNFGNPNFEFPKGDSSHGFYTTDMLVVGKKKNDTAYYASSIRPYLNTYGKGPFNTTAGIISDYIYKLSRKEIERHKVDYNKSGYVAPDAILNWPAFGDTSLGMAKQIAPFVDVNNDSCYNAMDGDYPFIQGDEAIYWINHQVKDLNGERLDLEYHWMLYGYDRPNDSALNQSLFLKYTVINRSEIEYDSMKLGAYLDFDLGDWHDDYVGCDSVYNIAYCYNGGSYDQDRGAYKGYGNNPPALGIKFLSDSMDTHVYFEGGALSQANNGDAYTARHWLNYLNARWKNGDHITYGGNGYNSLCASTSKTRYMFTGDPYNYTGWTERDTVCNRRPPGDRRSISSIPFFSLKAGERKTVEMVVGYGQLNKSQTAVGENIQEMVRVLNNAKAAWDSLTIDTTVFASNNNCLTTSLSEIHEVEEDEISIYPVPTKNALHIKSLSRIRKVELFDLKGTVLEVHVPNKLSLDLSLTNYPEGLYLIRVLSEDGNWTNKKVILQK